MSAKRTCWAVQPPPCGPRKVPRAATQSASSPSCLTSAIEDQAVSTGRLRAFKRGDLRVATSLCRSGRHIFLAQIPVCKALITFKKISDLYHLYEYLTVLTAEGDSRADFSFCTLIFLRGFKHVRAMPKLQLGTSSH